MDARARSLHGPPGRAIDREGFQQALDACLSRSQDRDITGLVVVKLNRLRDINLELGYDVGDALLAEIERRLVLCLRSADVMARTGSTEFAVILPALPGTGVSLLAAQKFQRVCREPFALGDRRVEPTLSIGISFAPRDGTAAADLLQRADAALREARRTGRDVVCYSECPSSDEAPSIEFERAFEKALHRCELELHFQPKVELDTGRLTGFEALTRWRTDDSRFQSPARFVPLAERTGLILPLTLWSFDAALRECRAWQSTLPGVSVAVNLSAALVATPELDQLVRDALRLWELPAELLTLEITETAVMAHTEASTDWLERFRDLGVRLSLDDFGTGYSSLAYLKKLPIDELKIDRAFVSGMLRSDEDRHIVQAVVDLARTFGLESVAEGVEDEETIDALSDMGCMAAQGFHIGRPMPVADIPGWLQSRPPTLGAGSSRRRAP